MSAPIKISACGHMMCRALAAASCALAVTGSHQVDQFAPRHDDVIAQLQASFPSERVGHESELGRVGDPRMIPGKEQVRSLDVDVKRAVLGGVVLHEPIIAQGVTDVKHRGVASSGPLALRSRAQLASVLEALRVKRMRGSLAEFVKASWHVLEPDTELEWSWHHEALCLHIQWLLEEQLAKLADKRHVMMAQNAAINVPPGTLKSRILSVCAPAWMWLRMPSWSVICISGTPEVAWRDADACRELIRSEWYRRTFRPQWELRADQDALGRYGNTGGGMRRSFGSTTKITGLRAHAIFNDDPNDPDEVMSETTRNSVNNRWNKTTYNRVNDERNAIRIGIQQRLHADDWTGNVLQNPWAPTNRTGWIHLCIPTEFDPARACVTPIWRDPRTVDGEVIHPERFTPEVLSAARTTLGSFGYAGQHQQSPSPAEGGMFARRFWRFWRAPTTDGIARRPEGCATHESAPARIITVKEMDWIAISVDATFKSKATSDRVGLQVWGGKRADRFLIADRTKVMSFTNTLAAIRELRVEFPNARKILVEDKANGSAIMDTLGAELGGLVAIEPHGGKASRAFACSPYVEAGNVYLPEGAACVEPFVDELAVFPNGKHDDRVDTMTQLLIDMGLSPAMARLAMLAGR